MWGDYGLRMTDHHRRISAQQLKIAEDTIKQRLRGQKYRLYKRINCNLGVFVSGNEVRIVTPGCCQHTPASPAPLLKTGLTNYD